MILSSGLEPEEDGMAAPVPLRSDFDAEGLRAVAKCARDPAHPR
ncbi:IS630 family transposase, partial [Methylobacterium sp. J-088]|nr:IS630 family transposase [Methylobacterium sp. J-088]